MFKAKVPQFEGGQGILKNLDIPLNIYIECKQLFVEHDGQSEFDTKGWSIPLKNVDWRTVKMTVNGMSFFEGQSFTRTDDGTLLWTDGNLRLKRQDTVFVEWTVDGAHLDIYGLEELENMLYVIVKKYPITVELEKQQYPLIVSKGDE